MWLFLTLVVLWLIFAYSGAIIRIIRGKPQSEGLPPQRSSSARGSTEAGPLPSINKDVYRPRAPSRTSGIKFEQVGSASQLPDGDALAGLHDAFTGAALNPVLGLHQCGTCKVYYHTESVSVLREVNEMRCVACGTANIVSLKVGQARTSQGRDYEPNVVTLNTFRQNFNQVITFEGQVVSVRTSRRGSDYAVMFEGKSWTRGLKLVFFRGAIGKMGGAPFVHSMDGRRVRVRGLLLNDPKFGPEIIVTERGMILEIK